MGGNYRAMYEAFIAGTLSPEGFCRADHLAMSFLALQDHEFFDAFKVVSDGMRRLAERAHCPEAYNQTLTFFYMSEVAEKMHHRDYGSAEEFVAGNALMLSRHFLWSRYTCDRLDSPLARKVPLMPDGHL